MNLEYCTPYILVNTINKFFIVLYRKIFPRTLTLSFIYHQLFVSSFALIQTGRFVNLIIDYEVK